MNALIVHPEYVCIAESHRRTGRLRGNVNGRLLMMWPIRTCEIQRIASVKCLGLMLIKQYSLVPQTKMITSKLIKTINCYHCCSRWDNCTSASGSEKQNNLSGRWYYHASRLSCLLYLLPFHPPLTHTNTLTMAVPSPAYPSIDDPR